MVSFRKLFGKKKKEEKPSTEPSIEPPEPVEKFSAEWFKDWLELAFKNGRADCLMHINQIPQLNDALLYALTDKYASLTSHEVSSYIQSELTVRCFGCRRLFTKDEISTICLAEAGALGNPNFFGPNDAALARGVCPGCRRLDVVASFDTTKINARMR